MIPRLALAFALVAIVPPLSSAATILLTLDITDGTHVDAISVDAEIIPSFFSLFRATGVSTTPGWQLQWTLHGEVHNENFQVDDLFFNFRVLNLSPQPSTFVIQASRPVAVLNRVQLYGGATGAGITDRNSDGAVLTTVGRPIYLSLIDDADFVSLLPHPNGLTAAPDESASFPSLDGIGFPTPLGEYFLQGRAPTSSVGVRIEYEISGGDESHVVGHFGLQQVPEPGAYCLTVIGSALVFLRLCWTRPSHSRTRRGPIEPLETRFALSAQAELLGQEISLPDWIPSDRIAELQSRIAAITVTDSGQQLALATAASRALISADDLLADPRYDHIDGGSGAGPNGDQPFSIAVLDSGINYISSFFGGNPGRILFRKDFVLSDGDNPADFIGHGSAVASIAAASTTSQIGLATGARIVALKVTDNNGVPTDAAIQAALSWVITNAAAYNIGAVNMSLLNFNIHVDDPLESFATDELAAIELMDIAVVSCSGNSFHPFSPDSGPTNPGVSYPAADPYSLAVGAVLDRTVGVPPNFCSSGPPGNNCQSGPDQIAGIT